MELSVRLRDMANGTVDCEDSVRVDSNEKMETTPDPA